MSPVVRNILAVIAGFVIGGFINSMLVSIGPSIYPPPEGVDVNNLESIKANLHRYSAAQLLIPFWAHAIGTLVGAFITALIAASKKMSLALLIGAIFMLGGITMVVIIGGPVWFIILDLLVAYFPMSFLGGKAAIAINSNKNNNLN